MREVRLIHQHQPRFNRQSKDWSRYAYLKLTLDEPFPRLSVVRTVRDDGGLYVGPLPSVGTARRVAEAIETAVPLRRCTATPGRQARSGPCAPAQLGVATCPCAGTISRAEYAALVDRVVTGLRRRPDLLLVPLEHRMRALADAERFEEAADVRDRAAALAQALRRQRQLESLMGSGRLVIEIGDTAAAELDGGRLTRAWLLEHLPLDEPALAEAPAGDRPLEDSSSSDPKAPTAPELPAPIDHPDPSTRAESAPDLFASTRPPPPASRHLADELWCVAGWLAAQAGVVRLVEAEHGLAEPLARVPSYQPRARAPERDQAGSLSS